MAAKTNAQWWEFARRNSPQFAAHTSEGTADLFTERGFGTITQAGMGTLNEFFGIIMPWYLQQVNISAAKDPLDAADVGETYGEVADGEYIQRMSIGSTKPITPAYRDLQDGDSPDPFVVRKPDTKSRFFGLNYDYQSLITMPDQWQIKRMFASEFGISEFMSGIFQGLENGYILQNYNNKLEVINAALNSTQHPLRQSQIVTVTMDAVPTQAQLVDFIRQVMMTVKTMEAMPQTGAFNAMGYKSVQDKSRLRLITRLGFDVDLALDVVRGSYNAQTLALDIPTVSVSNFGGAVPYSDAAYTTRAYPVYGKLGDVIGFAATEGATTATMTEDDIYWKDPNWDATTGGVFAILVDKGFIFHTRKNPYVVEPIRNPRGLYTNYWASAPNNGINYDPLYNMIVFKAAPTPAAAGVAAKSARKA